jgi:GAF domain/ANTAR domain
MCSTTHVMNDVSAQTTCPINDMQWIPGRLERQPSHEGTPGPVTAGVTALGSVVAFAGSGRQTRVYLALPGAVSARLKRQGPMTEHDAEPDPDLVGKLTLTRAQGDADEADLRAGLRGLAGIVSGGRSVEELLAKVAEFAAQAIPGVDGASVALIHWLDGKPRIDARAVTRDFVLEIDILQCDVTNEGPCMTCMQTRSPVISACMGGDDRWPRLGGRVARMGVHSALAFPLVVGDEVIGAINTYARDRDVFAEHSVRLGAQFAAPAAVAVHNAQLLAGARDRAEQLQSALGSRAVIDQAIGIIRSRSGGSADEAFARLRQISQSENVKLSVIANRLVEEAVRRANARQHRF